MGGGHGAPLTIGEARDKEGKRWCMHANIYLVLMHSECVQPNQLQAMSRELLDSGAQWGATRPGDGTLMGALVETEIADAP